MPKISHLPDAEAISGSEYVAVVQNGQTRKATASSLGGGDAAYPIDLTDGAEVDVPAAGIVTSDGTALASITAGSDIRTFLTTPSSANLRSALTDETGTGSAVFGTQPTLDRPTVAGMVTQTVADGFGDPNGYTCTYQGEKQRILEYVNEAQTTGAGTQAIMTWPIVDGTSVSIDFVVIMKAVGTTAKAGRWSGNVTYQRNSAGTPTIVGAADYATAQETTAGDGVAFNLASNTLQVDITSADGDDRNWGIQARIHEVVDDA